MEPVRCLPARTAAEAPRSFFACHVMYLIRGVAATHLIRGGEATYMFQWGSARGRESETVGGGGAS